MVEWFYGASIQALLFIFLLFKKKTTKTPPKKEQKQKQKQKKRKLLNLQEFCYLKEKLCKSITDDRISVFLFHSKFPIILINNGQFLNGSANDGSYLGREKKYLHIVSFGSAHGLQTVILYFPLVPAFRRLVSPVKRDKLFFVRLNHRSLARSFVRSFSCPFPRWFVCSFAFSSVQKKCCSLARLFVACFC